MQKIFGAVVSSPTGFAIEENGKKLLPLYIETSDLYSQVLCHRARAKGEKIKVMGVFDNGFFKVIKSEE